MTRPKLQTHPGAAARSTQHAARGPPRCTVHPPRRRSTQHAGHTQHFKHSPGRSTQHAGGARCTVHPPGGAARSTRAAPVVRYNPPLRRSTQHAALPRKHRGEAASPHHPAHAQSTGLATPKVLGSPPGAAPKKPAVVDFRFPRRPAPAPPSPPHPPPPRPPPSSHSGRARPGGAARAGARRGAGGAGPGAGRAEGWDRSPGPGWLGGRGGAARRGAAEGVPRVEGRRPGRRGRRPPEACEGGAGCSTPCRSCPRRARSARCGWPPRWSGGSSASRSWKLTSPRQSVSSLGQPNLQLFFELWPVEPCLAGCVVALTLARLTDAGTIVENDPPLALRLSGQLLLGAVKVYSKKMGYLFQDCNDALKIFKQVTTQ